MKIIHKYVLREHVGPLVFALSALTSLMLLNYVAKQLGNLVGKGLDWTVIGEFFLLSIPFTVAMTLPMAILVSVLYAFSRLAAENEITALKANGVSIARLLVPVLFGGMGMAILMIVFNDQILPRANHRLRTLQGDIARKKPTFAIKEQIINEVAPQQFFLRTNHLDRATNRMREVTIYDLSDPLRRRTIYADSGYMSFAEGGSDLQLTLYDGVMQEVPRETPTQLQRLYYKVDLIRVSGVANAFERDSGDTYKSDREMSVCELQNEVARYEREYLRANAEYRRAAAAAKGDVRAMVEQTISPPMFPGVRAPRSRQRSLGRTYCDVLVYLEKKGLGNLTLLSMRAASELVLPSTAFAQTGAQLPPAAPGVGQDTLRSKRDTSKRATPETVPRPVVDSAGRRADSASAVLVPTPAVQQPQPQIPVPPPAQIPPGVVQTDSAGLRAPVTTLPPSAVAPSSGMTGTVPANVAMESARSTMVAARTQMNQFAVEIQKKFSISFACIVFVLLGAPLALRFPRGGVGLVIGVSLGVFALYYVGLIAGESLADRLILTPFWAMWAANILFTIVGLFLLSRVESSSASARGGDLREFIDGLKHRWRRRRREPVRQEQVA